MLCRPLFNSRSESIEFFSTITRDQLIQQLAKSQEMLMNFQKELQASDIELQRQREENKRYSINFQIFMIVLINLSYQR